MYNAVKNLYTHGKLTKKNVANYVKLNLLTPEQYTDITGEEYNA